MLKSPGPKSSPNIHIHEGGLLVSEKGVTGRSAETYEGSHEATVYYRFSVYDDFLCLASLIVGFQSSRAEVVLGSL